MHGKEKLNYDFDMRERDRESMVINEIEKLKLTIYHVWDLFTKIKTLNYYGKIVINGFSTLTTIKKKKKAIKIFN